VPAPAPPAPGNQSVEEGGLVGVISAAGAIIVVGLGLAFVFVITLVSLGTVPDDQKSTVVAAAFTVLGTVVGTYFGVRAGAAGKERAEAARELETMKVQELAASVDATTAKNAIDRAEMRVETARSASQPSMPAL
jgi:threonine/homoserine/homoserine lactone efflux protein